MQHYALFDADGLNPAFYNDDIYPPGADGSRNAAIPAGAVLLTDAQWSDLLANQGLRRWDGQALQPYTPPPAPPLQPYLTGSDIIDGMSPAQAAAPGVDVRDLVRIQGRHPADEVKSKIARVEKALKVAAGTLSQQATPTGGL